MIIPSPTMREKLSYICKNERFHIIIQHWFNGSEYSSIDSVISLSKFVLGKEWKGNSKKIND